jgi:hypothetical protein
MICVPCLGAVLISKAPPDPLLYNRATIFLLPQLGNLKSGVIAQVDSSLPCVLLRELLKDNPASFLHIIQISMGNCPFLAYNGGVTSRQKVKP